MLIGSHVSPQDPLATAAAENADVVQIFLGNPQSWKAPKPRDDAAELKAAALPIYVHAPYLINVASANNRVRIPSRKILQQTCDAATDIGAAAVIVHGGQSPRTTTSTRVSSAGARRSTSWRRKCRCTWRTPPAATTRWPATSTPSPGCGTTSATPVSGSASTPAMPGRPARHWSTRSTGSRRITGRIDLVHCNDSKDSAGSGRDRHANFGTGQIDPELLVAVVKAADAPVICETADEGRKDDIAFLREKTSA